MSTGVGCCRSVRLVTHATDIGPSAVIEGKSWRMTAAPAVHVEPWLDSLVYRLETEEGSVVVTGDTAPCESVTELSRDADLMISLCTFVQDDIDGTAEAQYMCGTRDVAKMAQATGAKRLLLTHQHPKLDSPGQTERRCGTSSGNTRGRSSGAKR